MFICPESAFLQTIAVKDISKRDFDRLLIFLKVDFHVVRLKRCLFKVKIIFENLRYKDR